MPQRLRASKDSAWPKTYPLNHEWIRESLLRVGTQCEYPGCGHTAESAVECVYVTGYVCPQHATLIASQPVLVKVLDSFIWDMFLDNYDLTRQITHSGGDLLVEIGTKEKELAATRQALLKGELTEDALPVPSVDALFELIRRPTKVGSPDEELTRSRSHVL